MVKDFEFFLKKGDVKGQSPNKNLAYSTFKESLERIYFARQLLHKSKPKYVLENAYEAMREAADSILYIKGFKSFSHEASIVYLLKGGFNEKDILEFDSLEEYAMASSIMEKTAICQTQNRQYNWLIK